MYMMKGDKFSYLNEVSLFFLEIVKDLCIGKDFFYKIRHYLELL